jgi:hypothetical protein
MPCGDVPGRVHISIAGKAAGGAPEFRLALARLPIHQPGIRAAPEQDILLLAGRLKTIPMHTNIMA